MPRLITGRRGSVGSPILLIGQSGTAIQTTSVTSWTPATVSIALALGDMLATMGMWWDGHNNTGGDTPPPGDDNGTLVKAGAAAPTNPTGPTPPPGWPVNTQICHILSAAAGTHVLTPPVIDTSGDGYFLGLQLRKAGGNISLIASGNQFNGGTAGAVQSSVVSTVESTPQVGDLVLAGIVLDGDPTAFGLGPATGYTSILNTTTSSINVSGAFCYKYVTVPGVQSASWAWSDSFTEIARSVIAVYR